MSRDDSAIIDFAEACYDLETAHEAWVPKLIEAGAPVLDHGLGVCAIRCARPLEPGPLVIEGMYAMGGPTELGARLAELRSRLDTRLLWPISRAGLPKTLSEVTDKYDPATFRVVMDYFGFANDALGISAVNPGGRGLYLVIALSKVTSLSPKGRERWQMLAAHVGAGHRLREAVLDGQPMHGAETGLPFGAEVLIDPRDFRVTEATGQAQTKDARNSLREAAKTIDRARGPMRKSDPETALELWKALVRGRWSTIDWFDSDDRRYVLAIPNPPDLLDPRGLTEREMQVLSYAFFGLTNKMVGYHLGLSKGRVSTLMASAMRKLKVRSRAELIKKLKDFTPKRRR